MDKERYIFEKFRSKLNGDDCAVIGERAYCKDLFVEGVHFRHGWLSLREIGAKAMLVNISDMIATNARAKYALLGLALPREIGTREIDELCAGVSETAREWGIRIIGGDTIGSDRIALSVSLIGKCKRPVFRSGARVGDLIAHTGELGSVGRDLAVLLRDEISPASSQMQNRNDKISSLQDPSDEVRSPGDKISPALAELQSLDAETSTQNFAVQEGSGFDGLGGSDGVGIFDGKISARYGGELTVQGFSNGISAQGSGGKILAPSTECGISTQSLGNGIFMQSFEGGNSARNSDACALRRASQSFVAQNQDGEFFAKNFATQNLDTGNSTGNFVAQNLGAGNFTTQNLGTENSAENFTTQDSASCNSTGNFVAPATKFSEGRVAVEPVVKAGEQNFIASIAAKSSGENFTEAPVMKLAAENSARLTTENSVEQSISKSAAENSVTPLDMKFAEGISVQTAVKFAEEKSTCEIRGALAAGNFDSDAECAKSAAENSSAETSCVDFERGNSTAASEGAQDLRQNFAAKLPVQGSEQRNPASEILKCENAAAETIALKDDMSESLALENSAPKKEPSVKFAPRNPVLKNSAPQTDALANFVLQNDTSAANSMFKNTASASSASQNLVPRNDLSASAAVENSTPKSPVASVLQNFTCENSAIQNAAQQEGMSASLELQNSALRNSEPQNFMSQNSTAQNPTCENSAPQSPVCEGSVFDLREDLRAQISKNSRFVRPVLRDKFFYKAAKLISAAMDISDGLAQDLPRLLEASGVGARWIARPSEAALQSGEEYEILFSFAPKFLPKIYAIAAKTGVSINIIAEVCPRTPQSSMEFHDSSHHFVP